MTNRNERPNVLLIMVDQMKATSSHLWGSPFCRTPALEALAARGVLFDQAFTPHPLCVPARVAMWTSRWPHQTGARLNETPMPGGSSHAMRLWQQAGYRTALIGKNHCFEDAEDKALFDVWCEITHHGRPDRAMARGMEWWRPVEGIDRAHEVRRIMQGGGGQRVGEMPVDCGAFTYAFTDYEHADYSTGLIAGQTVRFLEAHRDQPFAAWISMPDPHTPYEAPRQYFEKIMAAGVELPPWREDEFETAPERNQILHRMIGIDGVEREHVVAVIAAYHAMVAFIDDAVGEIMAALDRLDLWRNTIVVFCSDHGDFAGEHMMMAKGGAFHDCLVRVPMIVAGAGIEARPCREKGLVSLIDLVPTLMHLQGLDIPATMMGRLMPGVTDAPARDAICAEYGAGGPRFRLGDLKAQNAKTGRAAIAESLQWREAEGLRKMVRTDRWKWVHDPLGDFDELYDLEADPHELTNRAGDETLGPIVDEMRDHLLRWSVLTEAHRVGPREEGLA